MLKEMISRLPMEKEWKTGRWKLKLQMNFVSIWTTAHRVGDGCDHNEDCDQVGQTFCDLEKHVCSCLPAFPIDGGSLCGKGKRHPKHTPFIISYLIAKAILLYSYVSVQPHLLLHFGSLPIWIVNGFSELMIAFRKTIMLPMLWKDEGQACLDILLMD